MVKMRTHDEAQTDDVVCFWRNYRRPTDCVVVGAKQGHFVWIKYGGRHRTVDKAGICHVRDHPSYSSDDSIDGLPSRVQAPHSKVSLKHEEAA